MKGRNTHSDEGKARISQRVKEWWASPEGQERKQRDAKVKITCVVEGCEKYTIARGLCSRHYQSMKRLSPDARDISDLTSEQRIFLSEYKRVVNPKRELTGHIAKDPNRRDDWRKAISDARGGRRTFVCKICGKEFQNGTSRGVVCSHECLLKSKSIAAKAAQVMKRDSVRRQVSERASKRIIIRDAKGRIAGFEN